MVDKIKGKRFAELTEGETFSFPPVEVTAGMIDEFTCLTGDHNLLHVDEEFASLSYFKGRIAPGMLTASLALAPLGDDTFNGTAFAMTGANWKFLNAVHIGDSLLVGARITSKKPRSNGKEGGKVVFWIEAHLSEGEKVLEGDVTVIIQ